MSAIDTIHYFPERDRRQGLAPAPRLCQSPPCKGSLAGRHGNAKFCGNTCKKRYLYRKYPTEFRLREAAKRERHRLVIRQRQRAYYKDNRQAILDARHELTRQKDIERLRQHPRCVICNDPLTIRQARRGVTCGRARKPACANVRTNWFRAA